MPEHSDLFIFSEEYYFKNKELDDDMMLSVVMMKREPSVDCMYLFMKSILESAGLSIECFV